VTGEKGERRAVSAGCLPRYHTPSRKFGPNSINLNLTVLFSPRSSPLLDPGDAGPASKRLAPGYTAKHIGGDGCRPEPT